MNIQWEETECLLTKGISNRLSVHHYMSWLLIKDSGWLIRVMHHPQWEALLRDSHLINHSQITWIKDHPIISTKCQTKWCNQNLKTVLAKEAKWYNNSHRIMQAKETKCYQAPYLKSLQDLIIVYRINNRNSQLAVGTIHSNSITNRDIL